MKDVIYIDMPTETQQLIYNLHQASGLDAQLVAAMMVEYIVYQMFQLAPIEVQDWLKLLPQQCANDRAPLPELHVARLEMVDICEMNNSLRAQVH